KGWGRTAHGAIPECRVRMAVLRFPATIDRFPRVWAFRLDRRGLQLLDQLAAAVQDEQPRRAALAEARMPRGERPLRDDGHQLEPGGVAGRTVVIRTDEAADAVLQVLGQHARWLAPPCFEPVRGSDRRVRIAAVPDRRATVEPLPARLASAKHLRRML